jgi:hypothetical protein
MRRLLALVLRPPKMSEALVDQGGQALTVVVTENSDADVVMM